ncbi:MAG: DUF1553 domain-containing protein [Verrucomicrobia bacterium]|nr:DUF1553 domain-containing protein [Verrucomicrobiota bacterium]
MKFMFRLENYFDPVALVASATILAAACCDVYAGESAGSDIHFSRDILPILSENCFACHGPDDGSRKADLRLDTKGGLYEKTDKHEPAVVPGDLEASEIWYRIVTLDEDDIMPPPKSKKILKPEQKELIKEWILAGAPWQGHWSFLKPERPTVPEITGTEFEIRNPIDAFVLSKLRLEELVPAPEADRRTMARRLSLDLTGLPPTPDEVEAFVGDISVNAYEKYVDHLLNSPHWGEHRARYWLDAARYADTHGLHFDNYREMWPYRDWVIGAFNRNMPFDQFTIEQIAGDLLENPSQDQIVATGFQRCNMTTNEGGTIEDENLANYANDRVTTTGWVWLGLTMNCTACHDHKFDPLTMRDFYSMAAFYRNTKQSGFDRNRRESDLYAVVPQSKSGMDRWKALPSEIEVAHGIYENREQEANAAFTNWLSGAETVLNGSPATFANQELRIPLIDNTPTTVFGEIENEEQEFHFSGKLGWRNDGPLGGAPILSKERTLEIGGVGDLEANEPFSMGAWVRLPEGFKGQGSLMSKMEESKQSGRGWDFFVRERDFGLSLAHRPRSNTLRVRASEAVMKAGVWQHLFVTYGGTRYAQDVKLYLDGEEVKVNRESDRLEHSIRTDVPLKIGGQLEENRLDGVAIQDLRIYRRQLGAPEIQALAAAPRLNELLSRARNEGLESTNNASREVLRGYFKVAQGGGWRNAYDQLGALELERQLIRGRSPVTLVQREKTDTEPMANILFRGQYDQPREKVSPAAIAALHPMPANAPKNRLGLARWLVSPENPLTARVSVNRFWQEIFGVGIVMSVDDFGAMGERPVNPELLDWLACEFLESGWNVKHLFKLIVMSSTYRQGAGTTAEKLDKDPENRLLSRGPRFRMDAEMIRDYALAASGLLARTVGGPSVKPYQPPGVWEAVAMPESNTGNYTPDSGEGLYRRSLYTFWKRAAPPAMMDLFNAPSRETCTVRRERTNTPLQALATLNDPEFIKAARHLAGMALVAGNDDAALDFVAKRLLSRSLAPDERVIVKETLDSMRSFYVNDPDSAKALLALGEMRSSVRVTEPQLAAMTMVVNQLMNLDEVLNK